MIINELKRRRISVVKCDIRFTTEPLVDLYTLFLDNKFFKNMKHIFFKIKESKLFQYSVLFIIIFNAFTIGLNTYNLGEFSRELIKYLDYLITIFFVIEISIRFIGEPRKSNFFKNGWNIFDTFIVLVSLIPIPNNSSFLLLRLLRVFRVLRVISIIPELKLIIESLIGSLKRVFYVSLLLFIILYIYATIGAIVFSNNIPERWSDVGVSMITLFQVLTLSSWEQVMLPLQDIYWWAWIYFFSFIIVCAITMLNLLIAILVDVVVNQKEKKDDVIKTRNNAEKLNEQFSEEISLDKLRKDQ